MKTNTNYRTSRKVIPYRPRKAATYPNAATTKDLLDRVLDYAVTAAASAGIVTVLVCLITFF